ncbi:hypothetical protein, partial [Xanthomonas translucens]
MLAFAALDVAALLGAAAFLPAVFFADATALLGEAAWLDLPAAAALALEAAGLALDTAGLAAAERFAGAAGLASALPSAGRRGGGRRP